MTLAPAYQLPPEAYFDQAWFEKEKRQVFGGSWLFAGLSSELAEDGAYKTVQAGLDQLIIVRDRGGALNAFHNICRHRGARLVSDKGQCSTFTCPYHKWSFGLDGSLRGVAQPEQFGELDFDQLGLHKASVANWMGLLFVHVDENPPMTFAQWSTGLAEELSVFETDQLQLLKQESFTFDANWKLYIENHVDWLHLWYVHPKTLGPLQHTFDEVKQFGSSFVSYDPLKPEHKAAYIEGNPLPDIPHLMDADKRYLETGAHFLFPNLPIFTDRSFFALTELVPISPEKTQMNITLLGMPGGDPDRFMQLFNKVTKDEDAEIITTIQSVVRSSRFSVGPIAHTYERAISCFHDHYLNLLNGPADVLQLKTN
tara:strand:+ start:8025 stop:9131 length:1107 start_codon:yes stop_codon:yes gene_type:complete